MILLFLIKYMTNTAGKTLHNRTGSLPNNIMTTIGFVPEELEYSSSCITTCMPEYYDSDLVNVIQEGTLVSVRVYFFNPIDPITFLDSNYTGPINTIGYVSNNVTFSASVPSTCQFQLYQNTCLCSNLENVIFHINEANYLQK